MLLPLKQYYPSWRRENKEIQVRSLIPWCCLVTDWCNVLRYLRMETGIGQTWVEKGSCFVYVSNCCTRRKSSLPIVLCRGLWAPMAENLWIINWRYCYTHRFLIGTLPNNRILASMRLADIWRKMMCLLTPFKLYEMWIQLKYLRHWIQSVMSFWKTVEEKSCVRVFVKHGIHLPTALRWKGGHTPSILLRKDDFQVAEEYMVWQS